MSLLRRIFNRPYRLARAAEGAGEYRRAAALYAEADLPEDAANALLFAAARAGSLEARLDAFRDALRWLPEEHPRRREVQAQIGLAVLDDAQRRGADSSEQKRKLVDAARRLERAGRPADAASAFELLGRVEDVARCLEKAGDIERLETLLEKTGAQERERRRHRGFIRDYEMAMKYGAREDAQKALRDALALAPNDRAVTDLLRRFEARLLRARRVELRVDGRQYVFVGMLPAVFGRTGAELTLRGASVSRRHAELRHEDGRLVLEDLASRNGTLVRGVPLAGPLPLDGPQNIGLGDDVELCITPERGAVRVEVLKGLDRGAELFVGEGSLRPRGAVFAVDFVQGWPRIVADKDAELRLDGVVCALPVTLLAEDRLELTQGPETHRIEVLP